MPALAHFQVFNTLSHSRATLERSAQVAEGMALAVWSNAHDATGYSTPGHHTIGCYLDGGLGTFRRDQPGHKGAPDKLCILPAEHQSAWIINGEIQLAHLYIEQEQFALGALALLDREPRSLQLQEATFLEDAEQSARFRQLCTLDWQEPGERLLPALGADMETGTVVQWLVQPGARVRPGDVVAVVETHKGAIDVEIFLDGVIGELAPVVSQQRLDLVSVVQQDFPVQGSGSSFWLQHHWKGIPGVPG